MSDISKINVNNTTYTLKDSRIPEMPNDSSKVLKGNGTWGKESSPYISGTSIGSAVLYSSEHATASAPYSVSDGSLTTAMGQESHAEGRGTRTYGSYSHTEGGSATTVSLTRVTSVAGNNKKYTVGTTLERYMIYNTVSINDISTYITSIDFTNNTMTVKESLGTLENATVSRTYTNVSYGTGSHAEGDNAIAYGNWTHAEGYSTYAEYNYSHAEGYLTRTAGAYAHSEGYETVAQGNAAHSEGNNTKTTANYAHAEGSETEASSLCAHSEGCGTTARASYSHAEGNSTVSYGDSSHAEGGIADKVQDTIVLTGSGNTYTAATSVYYRYLGRTISYNGISSTITSVDPVIKQIKVSINNSLGTLDGASCTIKCGSVSYGPRSHAEGGDCGATGDCSHAEGYRTSTKGTYSHSEGGSSVAYGNFSHAEGQSTTSYGKYSHAEGGPGNSGYTNAACTGSGTTYFASGDIYHTYVGQVISYNGVSARITKVNTISRQITVDRTLGEFNTATSFSITMSLMAYGDNSHAEGGSCCSFGTSSHAEGLSTASYGSSSHSEGNLTLAYSNYSHTEGYKTTGRGLYSHAEGFNTYTAGSSSHAEGGVSSPGKYNIVLTGSSTSYTYTATTMHDNYIGQPISYGSEETYITSIDTINKTITLQASLGTLDSATCKVTVYTTASGTSAHAEGTMCSARGDYAHAEGDSSAAIGSKSHAEGQYCTSTGLFSHAEGSHAIAKGNGSHAEGTYTIASGVGQHVAGKYNVEDLNNEYAEIIGIGNSVSSRKNGRVLDWNGNEKLLGSLTLGLGTGDETTLTAAQLKQLLALLE